MAHVQAHTEEFRLVLARTQVLDVNHACVTYYEADETGALREHLKAALTVDGGLALAAALQALAGGASQSQLEKPIRTLRGNRRHIAMVMNLMPGGETSMGRVLFSAMDITARVEAERMLRESSELNRLVLAGTNDGVWDWDLVADRIISNTRWHEMLGGEADKHLTTADS